MIFILLYFYFYIIYNASCYDFYINASKQPNLGTRFWTIDTIWWHKLRALTSLPFLAYQREGKSDIEGYDVNWDELFHDSELRLMRFLKMKV